MNQGDKFVSNSGLSFTIDSYVSNVEVYLTFDVTGYKTKAGKSDILRGKVRDRMNPSMYGVGFDTGGKHKTRSANKVFSKSYLTWKNMLKRCYGKTERKLHYSYRYCTVDPLWHNFQNFAEWFNDNYPLKEGDWQLDKDKLSSGCKIYSPKTCCFISRAENIGLVDNKICVKIRNISTGEIKSFSSLSNAARYIGSKSCTMSRLKRGICKHTAGWELA